LTYRVIKRIKGYQYVYEQSSYRVGNKVKTKSKYIGPVNPRFSGGSAQASPVNKSKPAPEKETVDIDDDLEQRAKLHIGVNLNFYGINEDSIIEEHRRVLNRLKEKGISLKGFSQIQIRHGKEVNTTEKGILNRKYIVTLPRKGGKYKFKREVSKTIVRASLDQIKKHRPDVYTDKIEAVFRPSYKATQKALVSYLRNSRDRKRGVKISVLKRWGKFSPVYGSKLKPVSFGLVDNTWRPDWQSELASIVAEIQRKGFKKAKARYLKQRTKALASYRYLIREMKSSPMRALKLSLNHRRKRERAKARIKATNEMIKKIEALERTNFIELFMS
jgi:hypothetical protein